MAATKSLSLSFLSLFVIALCFTSARATIIDITNKCNFTVWAAAVPGGGRQLNTNETWALEVASNTTGGRIWARTNCTFNATGVGQCQSGDCGGVLECQPNTTVTPPYTLAEYALDQYNGMDFYDISAVNGFNVPIKLSPVASGTRAINCTYDINNDCPSELKVAGGCKNPCTVFKTDQYCCTNSTTTCGPTDYSRFFKQRCPEIYTYPMDDATSTFSCQGSTNYTVIFCP
ncbi:hypothetical protein L6164_019499 [Bauhinia variegata]|uniref:Uncharacterized protein n=1 Tax=Bauhinia variegata TaxID=167791 RepID=A0ACB9MWT1_BAUVA|nr:hypothetical protein L6164_019499 [Bauhinia variegata]